MRKNIMILVILTLVNIIFAGNIQAQFDTDYYTSTRADSAHGFDVLRYEIALTIDDQEQYIDGCVVATVLAEENLTEINYELEELNVSSVLVNGNAADFTYNGELISIVLPGISADEEFTTTVNYDGNPQRSDDVYHLGMIFSSSYVFTLSDPSGCRWWWPAYDHPWDKAEVDFHVTMRDDWLVACNGIRTSMEDNGDGTITHHWEGSNPMAPHLPCISAANFVEVNQDYNGMLVQNFVTPAQENNAIIDLQNLPEIIGIFSDLYGPYPFEKYGNAVVPMVTFGAMEHQTMTTLASYMITGNHTYEPTIAHELAHQWFGNCLTPLTWADVWLSEGFAVYSEALYTEEMYGREAMLDYVYNNIQQYYMGWAGGGSHTIYNPTFNNYFNPVQYEKAASILHMLRKTVGDDDFFTILQNYFQQYHNQCVVTDDFQQVVESVSGDDVDQFFQQWIYEPGIPTYEYTYFVNKNLDVHRIKTYVKTSSNSGTDFYMKIPVVLNYGDQSFEILADSGPDTAIETIAEIELEDHQEVIFDPEGWMLVYGRTYRGVDINDAYTADGRVLIYWSDFWEEVEVDGFNIYRSETIDGIFEQLNSELITETMYEDSDVINGTTYYYRVTALAGEFYESALSEPFEATPIEFPFDLGVLVVDETSDGSGLQGNPSDEQVDDFYTEVLQVELTHYDYAVEGVPETEFLSHFSTIIWHDDDIGQHFINNALNSLGSYLVSGGNLLISGWKTANEIESSFLRDFMDEDNVEIISSMDFTGVVSEVYPQINVDYTKASPAFQTGLPLICTFPEATEFIFGYNSYSGTNQGLNCALDSNLNGRFIFLGFPLYFMEAEATAEFLAQFLEELGETGSEMVEQTENNLVFDAYPNPFNPVTKIHLSLPKKVEHLTVAIYNIKGQLIDLLAEGNYPEGEHYFNWYGNDLNGNSVSSGIYFYKLETEESVRIKKLMLIK